MDEWLFDFFFLYIEKIYISAMTTISTIKYIRSNAKRKTVNDFYKSKFDIIRFPCNNETSNEILM